METLFKKEFTYVTKDPKRKEVLIKKHLTEGFKIVFERMITIESEFEDKFEITLGFEKPIII